MTLAPGQATRLTADDLFLFNEGTHANLHEKLGAHPAEVDGERGTYFAVWAPSAGSVSVIGDFNGWAPGADPLSPRETSGIWEGFVAGTGHGMLYKFHVSSRESGYAVAKADPLAAFAEPAPRTASVIWDTSYTWRDSDWMARRASASALDAPISIYEVHPGSWRRVPEEGNRWLNYRELAHQLAEYVERLGFTHVELLPVMEHPFYGSWGYQTTGYFAPTSRYGTPQDLMYLVDYLHQRGIGVILDWVPSHFPSDEHGLVYFDGTHLYEHADPEKAIHPEWSSYQFNYGRHEVRSFLLSSAACWLDRYHADGLRVDAVASMLYLDYARGPGQWTPNAFGGREDLEAVSFLKQLNASMYRDRSIQTVAEESTDWPMVTAPVDAGGLGFGYKWDMGWMHDTLDYFARDPVFRKHHHNDLTFRRVYALSENFVLPLSHDEVVHGKRSLLNKMPGDDWQKFASLRLLFGYMYATPAKKLLFMGGEFAQWQEWSHDRSLDWHLADHDPHAGMQRWVADLNRFYRSEPALFERDFEDGGFEWIDVNDAEHSTLSFLRRGRGGAVVVAAFNFTPVPRENVRLGVPVDGAWEEALNSDSGHYWGSGMGNLGRVEASPMGAFGHPASLTVTLPPLAAIFLRPAADDAGGGSSAVGPAAAARP
jgi:1,4-alpha-glucan branching enzyme